MVKPAAGSYVPAVVWECFERELDAEPCLTDPRTKRQQAQTEAVLESLAGTEGTQALGLATCKLADIKSRLVFTCIGRAAG